MIFSQKNELISDQSLDEMLLSLRDNENTQIKPPTINTFRLQMEAERRRNRRQLQIATIAAWFSVTATMTFLAYFALVLMPQIERVFSPSTRPSIAQLKQSLASYGGLFEAFGIALLLGYIFSALLLIVKKDILLTKKD